MARRSLPIKLVFSGFDGPCGRTLFAVRFSLRDAHVPIPVGNSDRYGRRDRTSFFGNVQPRRMDRRIGPIRFRLDWALYRDRRSFRAHSLIRRLQFLFRSPRTGSLLYFRESLDCLHAICSRNTRIYKDTCEDADGNLATLQAGLVLTAFDEDADEQGK